MGKRLIKVPRPTSRGFLRSDFVDLYGEECSIQESSLATKPALWLGQCHEKQHPVTGEALGARMHLSQAHARALLPMLEHFARTGRLPGRGYDKARAADTTGKP